MVALPGFASCNQKAPDADAAMNTLVLADTPVDRIEEPVEVFVEEDATHGTLLGSAQITCYWTDFPPCSLIVRGEILDGIRRASSVG